MTNILSIVYSLILFSASTIMAVSQSTSSSNGSSYITGSPLTLEDAKSRSNLILLGTITNLGYSDFRGKGLLVYGSVTVMASTTYLGTATSSVKVRIGLTRQDEAPVQGTQYLFFISKKEHHNYVIEFLPSTDDNIAKVKALIASAPATK